MFTLCSRNSVLVIQGEISELDHSRRQVTRIGQNRIEKVRKAFKKSSFHLQNNEILTNKPSNQKKSFLTSCLSVQFVVGIGRGAFSHRALLSTQPSLRLRSWTASSYQGLCFLLTVFLSHLIETTRWWLRDLWWSALLQPREAKIYSK